MEGSTWMGVSGCRGHLDAGSTWIQGSIWMRESGREYVDRGEWMGVFG